MSNMTKKDYELIASAFKMEMGRLDSALRFKGKVSNYNEGEMSGLKIGINNMVFVLSRNDPKFDKVKFLTACGIRQTPVVSGFIADTHYDVKD